MSLQTAIPPAVQLIFIINSSYPLHKPDARLFCPHSNPYLDPLSSTLRAREKDDNFPRSPITALTVPFLHFHEKHSPLLKFMAFTNPLPHLGLQVLLML